MVYMLVHIEERYPINLYVFSGEKALSFPEIRRNTLKNDISFGSVGANLIKICVAKVCFRSIPANHYLLN